MLACRWYAARWHSRPLTLWCSTRISPTVLWQTLLSISAWNPPEYVLLVLTLHSCVLLWQLLCRRGGPLPISCTQLTLQVGMLKVAGASQLLLLAAAAAQAPTLPVQQRQPRTSGVGDNQLAGQQEQAQAQSAGTAAAASKAAAGKHAQVAEQLLKAVALLPDKVRSLQQQHDYQFAAHIIAVPAMA